MTPQEEQETMDHLREWIAPGDTIYAVLRHVDSRKMNRVIGLVKIREDGTPIHVGRLAAQVLGLKYDHDREGVRINGAGMDMGLALVYDLSRALFPEGGTVDNDGMSLTHRWL